MAQYRFSIPSQCLSFPVELRAIIPDGERDVPTLWLLHGANSDLNEWFDDTSLARYLQGRRMAVVATSIYNGFGVNMQHGAPYADFLQSEWIPHVRNVLPCLAHARERNFLAGASMGGFAVARLAVNRPEWFSKVGSLAGSIGMPTIYERYERGIQPGGRDFGWAFGCYENLVNNENDVVYMARKCVERGCAPDFYLCCGTEDFGYALTTIARDDLRLVGAQVEWHESPGAHSYDCWDEHLPAFLDWLQGKGVEA